MRPRWMDVSPGHDANMTCIRQTSESIPASLPSSAFRTHHQISFSCWAAGINVEFLFHFSNFNYSPTWWFPRKDSQVGLTSLQIAATRDVFILHLMKGNSVLFRYRRFRLVAWRLHLSDAVWRIRSATLPNGNWNEVEHPLRIWLAKTWQSRKHCSGKFCCINMCVRHT